MPNIKFADLTERRRLHFFKMNQDTPKGGENVAVNAADIFGLGVSPGVVRGTVFLQSTGMISCVFRKDRFW